MQEITLNQKEWVLNQSKKFFENFNSATQPIRLSAEEYPAIISVAPILRKILDIILLEVPFSDFKRMDKETYRELCTLDIDKMEWGLVQKTCSIIISAKPSMILHSEILDFFDKIFNCVHSKKDRLDFCDVCNGKGKLKSKKSEQNNSLLAYSEIVSIVVGISEYLTTKINSIKEETVLKTWWELSSRERFDADGEIARIHKVKQPVSPIIK